MLAENTALWDQRQRTLLFPAKAIPGVYGVLYDTHYGLHYRIGTLSLGKANLL
jgi:hypothetical protein